MTELILVVSVTTTQSWLQFYLADDAASAAEVANAMKLSPWEATRHLASLNILRLLKVRYRVHNSKGDLGFLGHGAESLLGPRIRNIGTR